MVRGAIATLVGISVIFTGCTDSDPGAADPTVPTAASTSVTTVAAPDVSKIPETIDAAYLNAVLAALDEVDGQATRLIYAEKRFTPEAADLLNAVYDDAETDRHANGWITALAQDPELRSIKPDPGNRKTTVSRLITVTPVCVWVAVERDHSLDSVNPEPPRVEYVALRPLDKSNDPKNRNRTAWMITADGFNPDGSEPGNQCGSS